MHKGIIGYTIIMASLSIIMILMPASVGIATVYDLFSNSENILSGISHKILHFKVNGQGMDMVIGKRDDGGELISKVRGDKFLPFYRDKNGGLAVHFTGIDRYKASSISTLMSAIQPVMGFVNRHNHSTRYVSLRLDRGFSLKGFTDRSIANSERFFAFPSAEKINTIDSGRFAIGHYRAQATARAVELYYNSRLKASGYKKLVEKKGLTLYQQGKRLFLLNVEEKGKYVSIITYTVKDR